MKLLDLARAALKEYDREHDEGGPPTLATKVELFDFATPGDPAETAGHWMIIQAERAERWFSPPVTRAELEVRYPGAVLIALPEGSENARPATQEEAAEIGRLVAAVAAQEGFTAEEQEEAMANALRDAANALRCFRALLNEGRT